MVASMEKASVVTSSLCKKRSTGSRRHTDNDMKCDICKKTLLAKDWLGIFIDRFSLNVHKHSRCEVKASKRIRRALNLYAHS